MFPSAPDTAVLHQVGDVAVVPAGFGVCPVGEGCGTASVTYQVVGSGQTTISASRTNCGEGRTCVRGEGFFSVQVNVP